MLTDPNGAPMAGAAVLVERRVAGAWQPLASLVTDAAGRAVTALRLGAVRDDNVVRASWAGDATYPPAISGDAQVELVRRTATVVLTGPSRVLDEQPVILAVQWAADDGAPVVGEVQLEERRGDRWWTLATLVTDATGVGTIELRPRTDSVLRVEAPQLDWVQAAQSPWKRIDNLPPARPVRMGRSVPRPRIHLPNQERAEGVGAAPVATRIPDAVWRSMVGRTWHPGCPVGRDGLRLLRVNYVDFSGYRRRGELAVATVPSANSRVPSPSCTTAASRSGRCTGSTGPAGPAGSRAPTTCDRWRPATPRPSTAATSWGARVCAHLIPTAAPST